MNTMTTQLYNVVTSSGTILSGGDAVELDVAQAVAMKYIERYRKYATVDPIDNPVTQSPPQTQTEPVDAGAETGSSVAVASSGLFTIGSAKWCLVHQRAVKNVDSKDRNGTIHANRFHWSAVMRTALQGGELRGKQGEWLAEQESTIARAIASHERRGTSYPRLKLNDLTWSF